MSGPEETHKAGPEETQGSQAPQGPVPPVAEPEPDPDENLPARLGEERLAEPVVRTGMFGVQDTPDTVKACGHTYVNPADQGILRRDVDERGLTVQAHVWTWQGKRSVWALSGCGNEVYVRVDDNDFRGYNLAGSG